MINKYDPTWIEVDEYLRSRLNELRQDLEALGCPDQRSGELRGAIDELKELRKLVEEPKPTRTPQEETNLLTY